MTTNLAINSLIKGWCGLYIVNRDNVGSGLRVSLTYTILDCPKVAKMSEKPPIWLDFVQCLTMLPHIRESKVPYSTGVCSALYAEINQSKYPDF